MSLLRLFFTLLLNSPTTVPSLPPIPNLALTYNEPVIDRVMFDRSHPSPQMPALKSGEAALTKCDYRCRTGCRYHFIKHQRVQDHWHVTIAIEHFDVQTNLTDTIYLPMMAPVLLRAHEEGHREMNERIYQDAYFLARKIGTEVLSRTWEGDGTTPDAAGDAASNVAFNYFNTIYLTATANRAGKLGVIYDRLTDHGRNNLYVANAIRLSFQEEKTAATQSGELMHPTTQP